MSAGFSTPSTFRDGQLTACHRLLHPQDLGLEMSHSPTPRLEAIAFDAVASTRTRGFTTFDTSAANAWNSASPELVASKF